ncbi:MAG TPA: ROK family protein [Solirubrobacterales bacterium]|nr:ROK family protein [Solirubrobacterales bacterium]
MSSREAIGVDLGGTKLATGVVDSQQNVLHTSRESSTGRSEDEVVSAIEQELREAMEARPGVVGAGLGIPCTIDRERGVAINAVNLEITDVPIRDLMRERLGIPIFIDNDANCAALAEHRFGAAKGAENAILLTIGTGIGGGIIVNRQVYRGTTGAAAELGHVVVDENGPPCQGTCPNNGCVETMASGTALAREGTAAAGRRPESTLARAMQGGGISGKVVTDAALAGDEVALEVVAEAGRHLGVALASLVNIFDPDVMVIGGGVAAGARDLLVEPAREEMRRRALPPMNRTPVALAELGGDAGMIGAAQMVLEELAGT